MTNMPSPSIFLKKEGAGEVIKIIFGFEFYSNLGEHKLWITDDRYTNILSKSKKWIWEGEHKKNGIPFEEFRTYI